MLLDLIKAAILGVVEGFTEFLPISSTGHLIIASSLLNFTVLENTFEIFIQLGAVVAVILFYWPKLWALVRTIGNGASQRFWINLILAFLPAAVIGFLLADLVDQYLFSPLVVAITLILGGVVFLVVENRPQPDPATLVNDLSQLTPRQALTIGFAQTIALIPGVSRSGASIVAGMLSGLSRSAATEFSFYLAIPTLGMATLYSLVRDLDQVQGDVLLLLLVGTVVSGIVAWLSIGWLLRFVATNTFKPFGYYRIAAGVLLLALLALGVVRA